AAWASSARRSPSCRTSPARRRPCRSPSTRSRRCPAETPRRCGFAFFRSFFRSRRSWRPSSFCAAPTRAPPALMLDFDARWRAGAFSLEATFSTGAGITALFGRSGAGKTTLLNLIAGLARPLSGRIAVGGRKLYDSRAGIDLPPHRRHVGYVFQEGRLLPHLTVEHNLLYGRFFARRRSGADTVSSFEHTVKLLG